MFTKEEAEKFADWIIKKENEMLAAKYPICPKVQKMTDDELLKALGV